MLADHKEVEDPSRKGNWLSPVNLGVSFGSSSLCFRVNFNYICCSHTFRTCETQLNVVNKTFFCVFAQCQAGVEP